MAAGLQEDLLYAGSRAAPKHFTDSPKILLLNVELELKSEKENAEISSRTRPSTRRSWRRSGPSSARTSGRERAQVVLSRLATGLATQYGDRGMFCAGRVPEDDMHRVAFATGGMVQSTVNDLNAEVMGTCAEFEERQVGNERFNLFTGCPLARTATIVLRGGAEQFIEEAHRSMHDAIMIVRRAVKNAAIVPEAVPVSKVLRNYSRTLMGRERLFNAFAKALESSEAAWTTPALTRRRP